MGKLALPGPGINEVTQFSVIVVHNTIRNIQKYREYVGVQAIRHNEPPLAQQLQPSVQTLFRQSHVHQIPGGEKPAA